MRQYVLKDSESKKYFYSNDNFKGGACKLVEKKEEATVVSKNRAKEIKKSYFQSLIEEI